MERSTWIAYISCLSLTAAMTSVEGSANISSKDKSSSLYVSQSSFLQASSGSDSQESFEQSEMYITYEPEISSSSSREWVRARASMLTAQMIAKQRLTSLMEKNFSYYDVYTGVKSFGPSFISIELSYDLKDENTVRDFIEGQVESLSRKGIHHDELAMAQKLLIDEVDTLLKSQKSEDELFIYKLHETEFLKEGSGLSFDEFLQQHRQSLLEIRPEEAFFALGRYLDYNNKILETISRKDIEQERASDALSLQIMGSINREWNCDEESSGGFSSLKKGLSNQNGSTEPYYGLRLSDGDRKLIRKLITTMADKNVFQLLLDKKSMEKLGKQIRPVHPLRFMGFILADSHLRSSLHSFSKNHFKWSSFVDGFKDRMKDEARRDGLYPYLPGFCQELGADYGKMSSYIERGDFEGLIKHFF